jgi:hypothetical protein
VALLAYGVVQFEETGLIYETIALWNLSGAPVLGEGRLVGELMSSYLGRNPEARLLKLGAWAVYVLTGTLSWAHIRLREESPVRLKLTTAERA